MNSDEKHQTDQVRYNDELDDVNESQQSKRKKYKYGIVYLSHIPDGLNARLLRQTMSTHGEVGRIYLEPDGDLSRHKYLEGWVEFKKKRVAKKVAKELNGKEIKFGKKRCKLNGQVWTVKYLHRFKWTHLTEQLVYNKKIQDQRKKFTLLQAKKQADFFHKMIHKSKKETTTTKRSIRQKNPIENGNELTVKVDKELLSNIFKKVS